MKKLILLLVFMVSVVILQAQNSLLDPTFGTNGIVKTDMGSPFNFAVSVQVFVQPDGSIYQLLEGAGQVFIEKKHPDGSADLTYGHNGLSVSAAVLGPIGAIQTDGKIVIAGYTKSPSQTIYTNKFKLVRFNTDGSLDSAFSTDDSYDFGLSNTPNAIAIRSDGKIGVVGYAQSSLQDDVPSMILALYNTDGSLEMDSKDRTPYFSPSLIAFQNDGKILIVGWDPFNGSVLARYHTDGTLDSGFNGNGVQKANGPGFIAVQGDDKIITGGSGELVRYNSDGGIDSSFGIDGTQSINLGAFSIALQSDGKIIAGENISDGSNTNFAMARYNSDGSIDSTFGADGTQATNFGAGYFISSIALQRDGKIVAGGYTLDGSNIKFVIGRYNNDGSVDNSFDGEGGLIDHISRGDTHYTGIAVQSDGKAVAAGYTWNGSNYDFAVVRYNLDGSLDNTFAGGGKKITDFDSSDDKAAAIAIQTDGKIVVAGSAGDHIDIARYNTDGSLDNTFDGDGLVTGHFSYTDAVTSIAIQSDGKLLVGGTALLRYNTNGSPDLSFNGNGKVSQSCNAIALENNGNIFIVGGDHIFKYNSNGLLDSVFGERGIGFSDREGEFFVAKCVGIQNDGKVVVGGNLFLGTKGATWNEGAFLIRFKADGGYDETFNRNGKSNGLAISVISALILSDQKIIIAGSGSFALFRYNTDGSLSEDGFETTVASIGDAGFAGLALAGNKLYAAGFGQYLGNLGVVARYQLTAGGQSITTNVAQDSICTASSLKVAFTTTGIFNTDNIFTAQLSDSTGSFASPVNIGNITTAGSDTINAVIPANTPAGTGYRIRVVSSDPAVTGSDNGSNLTIRDNCNLPKIFALNAHVFEGNNGTHNATFALLLSRFSPVPVTVEYQTADNTAVAPFDYIQKTGTVVFPANSIIQFVTVEVKGDLLDENNETFNLLLNGAINAAIVRKKVTCTIINDDRPPFIKVHDTTTTESNGQARIRVSLSEPSGKRVKVTYDTENGSAKAPEDYTAIRNGILIFEPGETVQYISVIVNQDAVNEPTEKFSVRLRYADNAILGWGNRRESEVRILNSHAATYSMSKSNIIDIGGQHKIIIFPNPANQQINVRMDNEIANGNITIQLMDYSGMLIKQWMNNYESTGQVISLPVGNITNGLYILVIRDSKGNHVQHKIEVQH